MTGEPTQTTPVDRPSLEDIFDPIHYEDILDWPGEKIAWELVRHSKEYRESYDKYKALPPEAQNCEYKGNKKEIPGDMSMKYFLNKNKKKPTETTQALTYGDYCAKYAKNERIKLKCIDYLEMRKYKLRAFFDYNLSYDQIMASIGKNFRIFTPPNIVDQRGIFGATHKKLKKTEIMLVIDLSHEIGAQLKTSHALLKEIVKDLKSENSSIVKKKLVVTKPLKVSQQRFDPYPIRCAIMFCKAICHGYNKKEIKESWFKSKSRKVLSRTTDGDGMIEDSEILRAIKSIKHYLPAGKHGNNILMLGTISKATVQKIS